MVMPELRALFEASYPEARIAQIEDDHARLMDGLRAGDLATWS